MKLKSFLQKLMLIVSVLLLAVCFASGMVTDSAGDTGAAKLQSFVAMLTLMISVGSILFRVSDGEKPLDWMLCGAALGTVICLCVVLGVDENIFAAGLLLVMYLLELLLCVCCKVCRHCGFWS